MSDQVQTETSPEDDLGHDSGVPSFEEVEQAKAELKKLDVYDYLALQKRLTDLENQTRLPEAGGSVNTWMVSPRGVELQITARGESPVEALKQVMIALRYGMDHYNLLPRYSARAVATSAPANQTPQTPPPANPPTQQPAATPNTPPAARANQPVMPGGSEVIQVRSISKVMNPDGSFRFSVKGGPYLKFGVALWPEVAGAQGMDGASWQAGQEYTPPVGMEYAVCATDQKGRKKVVGFQSNP